MRVNGAILWGIRMLVLTVVFILCSVFFGYVAGIICAGISLLYFLGDDMRYGGVE